MLAQHLHENGFADAATTVIVTRRIPLVRVKAVQFDCTVDITFQVESGITNTLTVVKYLDSYPSLKPLLMVVKYYLYQEHLNEPYTGGMGSYALTLLWVSFFQQLERFHIYLEGLDLGMMLVNFFHYYGWVFSYSKGISVRNGGSYFDKHKRESSHGYSSEKVSKLYIEDPNNIYNNVARSTYQMDEIILLFRSAYRLLSHENGSSKLGRIVVRPVTRQGSGE
jgi:non-canonical poly(A) RNA polymerase PAPD5/7